MKRNGINKRIKIYLFIGFPVFIILSCNPEKKTETPVPSDVVMVEDEDSEMNEAINKAVKSLDIFDRALALSEKDTTLADFCLKVKFKYPEGHEHLWLSNIRKENGIYTGVVDNEVAYTKEVKEGDTVTIDYARITDWMYTENHVLQGGYTIRVLRNRMTKQERFMFDLTNGVIIED